MQTAYIMTGTLNDDQTVTLDEALPLAPMKVRLAIEPLAPSQRARTTRSSPKFRGGSTRAAIGLPAVEVI